MKREEEKRERNEGREERREGEKLGGKKGKEGERGWGKERKLMTCVMVTNTSNIPWLPPKKYSCKTLCKNLTPKYIGM